MDPAEAKRFLPFKPHDQTSNQRLVYEQMISPENRELILQTVKEGKDEGWCMEDEGLVDGGWLGLMWKWGRDCIVRGNAIDTCVNVQRSVERTS